MHSKSGCTFVAFFVSGLPGVMLIRVFILSETIDTTNGERR